MRYGFGVDLGGTTVKIAYFDENGTMLNKWEIPTVVANNGERILPDIAASILQFIEQKNIDRSTIIGFPVKAGNDANVAALGEFWKGGGQGTQNMVFATLGTGVGGGIVVGGQLLHGAHGSGAEIGHLVLNRDETEQCGCGKRGCVEQYCSATGIVRLAHKALEASNEFSTLRQHNPLTCKDIFDCGKAGDPLAQQVLDQFYAYLGEFLANICDVIDPEAVVLGGGVSKAGQMLLDGVRPHFDRCVFHAASGARFALASLGNDAGAYGAFKLAVDAFA